MNDAFSLRQGNTIRMGTSRIEKVLSLTQEGAFVLQSLKHIATGREYVQGGAMLPDEFFVTVNGETLSGSSGGYTLESVQTATLSQGELETIITLSRETLTIIRHYVAYPGLAVLQEWTEYRNNAAVAVTISRPSLFVQRILPRQREELQFSYMTGGANYTGSQIYKTLPVTDGFVKLFDSMGEPEVIEVDGHKGNTWHPRMNGCAVWNEFFVVSIGQEGLFRTFDYQGWWKAAMSNCDRDPALSGHCELIDYSLAPGETLRIAPTTAGFYVGDKDDMGNTINEYIYRYKWDYTREKYFNRTNLYIWRSAPLAERVFQMVKAARYCGFERIWVDDFWFDAKGNWNGIFGDDWREVNEYIQRNGMLFRLWMPPWHADRLSKVWRDHPDWMLDFHGNWYNWTIDMSKEDAYQWILAMLCEKQKEFGTYDLRVDGDPCNLQNNGSFDTDNKGDWNATLKQSENFYRLYREFKTTNPEAGLDGCSSGGHTLGIESARYTDQHQITDGWCYHMGGYDTTLLLPIDKHQEMPIAGNPAFDWKTNDASSLNLFCAPGANMQNPEQSFSIDALEGMRKNLELFYWLREQGVYGRYIKVFRPLTEHCDPTFLLQRMTWENSKGLLMISANPLNPILGKTDRVYLKGLVADETYHIESRLGAMQPETRTGAEWMRDGVELRNVQAGEYLFMNLPNRPGTNGEHSMPQPPALITAEENTWLGHTGIGVSWKAPMNTVNISYYELSKNGEVITKVAAGTYYFDENASINDQYQVRSVGYGGETSEWADS